MAGRVRGLHGPDQAGDDGRSGKTEKARVGKIEGGETEKARVALPEKRLRFIGVCLCSWKVDVRLPGQGNSNTHGVRPVHQIISMIKWIRTSKLSIKNSLSLCLCWSVHASTLQFAFLPAEETPRRWHHMCMYSFTRYRGTSPIRKRLPLGPYSRGMPRALRWS